MSSLIAASMPNNLVRADDDRIYPAFWKAPVEIPRNGDTVGDVASFVNPYWPGGGGLMGDSGDVQCGSLEAVWNGLLDPAIGTGASSRFGFVGVTRDQWGTAIASCTVLLFRTANNVLVDSTTSNPDGNFLLNTPYYPDTHYIVSHKTGSPDVDGATVNTLIGV